MLTHDQIMKLAFTKFPDGSIVNVDIENEKGEVVFEGQHLNPEFQNLFMSAPAMYQVLSYQSEGLAALIEMAKLAGAKDILPNLTDMKLAVDNALTLVQIGAEDFVKKSEKSH